MKYLSAQEVLVIHAEIIDQTGGRHGVLDTNLLASIVNKPKTIVFGKKVYKSVYEKAAVYLESFAQYHVFVDGNKRTAIASATRFLFINGIELQASNKDVETFVVDVAVKKADLMAITEWLKSKSKK